MKPTDKTTLKDIKIYIRKHKLNKPEINMSMSKAQLVAHLKKHGHWGGAGPPNTHIKFSDKKTYKKKGSVYKELTGGKILSNAQIKQKKKQKAMLADLRL